MGKATMDKMMRARMEKEVAEMGVADCQFNTGLRYDQGEDFPRDHAEAAKWYRKAAEQGHAEAQFDLGVCYYNGKGVPQDRAEAVKWFLKVAEQGNAKAQRNLGVCYAQGKGVPQDHAEAVEWYRKAAEQGHADAQLLLAVCYAQGEGVPQDHVQAHAWCNLAAAYGNEDAGKLRDAVADVMTPSQIAEARKIAWKFVTRKTSAPSRTDESPAGAAISGTAFFITEDGYAVTSLHVVEEADLVLLGSPEGPLPASVVATDRGNDLALLKAEGSFAALPLAGSRGVRPGEQVYTVGYPNAALQGASPKFTGGLVNSLSGAMDDSRFFQIGTPIQPGSSGGPLVDAEGAVVGVVKARLSEAAAIATSGGLPQNVNYALRSSFALAFLEASDGALSGLSRPSGRKRSPEEIAAAVTAATVPVVVQ